ncbi:GreA/GreB family elongation factor [Brevibacillus massiliensis]|uniref:GreA/GreB family elongation factor n=1 Tax=Brevibacillus massiliensis TaxID=1118054 RepID=UPI0002D960DB|nr:GreA/GreB family elongation factor [Brevibacillus massiliensis]
MSLSHQQAYKDSLVKQLRYFDEQKSAFLDQHFPYSSEGLRERQKIDRLLVRYVSEVERMVSASDETTLQSTVLIGSRVTIKYTNDNETETLTICFPDQTDPDAGHISFLSPFGMQLLLASKNERIQIDTPAGSLEVSIEEIEYSEWEGLTSE